MTDIVSNSVLPAHREAVTLRTSDGLNLVAELAMPPENAPKATILCLHPNPQAEGMMDSHVFRKAAWRLPALADVAVLRWNTRGTCSAAGRSEGAFDRGVGEGKDLHAALEYAVLRGLPNIWLVGWSFGTDVALMHGNVEPVRGAVLLSPPLKWSGPEALAAWAESHRPLVALVPELDEFLSPTQARERFAMVPHSEVIEVPHCKHLWIGEKYVRIALQEIVSRVNPAQPLLDWTWDGPMGKWDDLAGGLQTAL